MATEAPKQLSADGRYGFPSPDHLRTVRVTINGDARRLVVAYDVDAGWVECPLLDEKGHPQHINGEYIFKREFGKIRAIIID